MGENIRGIAAPVVRLAVAGPPRTTPGPVCVDYLAVGALTHSVRVLDIGLDIRHTQALTQSSRTKVGYRSNSSQ